jgi:hypothetical protein
MMQDLAKMQKGMERVQNELAQTKVEGSSGGGAVKVTCTGTFDFRSVKISKEAVDPEDIETLEDLVLTAIKDACMKAQDLGQKKMSASMGNIQLPPGMGF